MSTVARHEQYNFYVIKKIKTENNELNSEAENNVCNQILKTNSNVIYYLGDTVSVTGVSSEGQSIVTANGQSFNYDEYIFYKYHADQIFEIFKNKNYLNDYIPPHAQVLSYADHLSVWRRERADLFDMYHHTDVAELLAGMTLGTDITMSVDLKSDLQRSGLSHIAVMSGYNVILMFGLIILFFKFINFTLSKINILSSKIYFLQSYKVQTLISLLLLSVLPVINDYDSPIVRAYIFIFISSVYALVGRVENYRHIFWLTLFFITIHSPHRALWDVGLHLSVLAVGSLIYFEKYIKSKNTFMKYIYVALCAQLFTAPYISYMFGVWSPLSIIANLSVGFILPVISILGILENIIYTFHIDLLSQSISILTDMMMRYIILVAHTL